QKARFCICPENCYDEVYSHGYFSEKMPGAWFGGCVPLYIGCYNIDGLNIPKECYIDLRDFVKKTKEKTKILYSELHNKINSFREKDYTKMIHAKKKQKKKKKLYTQNLIKRLNHLEKMIIKT